MTVLKLHIITFSRPQRTAFQQLVVLQIKF